jgi:hypothetical protein
MTWLRRTCRQVAALLIAREDRTLRLPDWVALKLHLMACEACPKFENQILTLRTAMEQWRHDDRDGLEGPAPGKQPPE